MESWRRDVAASTGSAMFHAENTGDAAAALAQASTAATRLPGPDRVPAQYFWPTERCRHWFLDRFAFYHALPPIALNYGGDFTEYRDTMPTDLALKLPFYNIYRAMTRLSWPSNWRSSDPLPCVPIPVLDLGCELFRAAMEADSVAQEEDIVTLTIERKLARVLSICALARASDRRPVSHQLTRSYGRYFEALRLLLLSDANSTLRLRSGGVALQLPRSDYLDRLTRVEFNVAECTSLRVHYASRGCWEQESRMLKTAVPAFRQPLNLMAADVLFSSLDWEPQRAPTLDRSLECPAIGLCDALASVEIPLPVVEDGLHKFECSDLVADGGYRGDDQMLFSLHWDSEEDSADSEGELAIPNGIVATCRTNYPLNATDRRYSVAPGIFDRSGPASAPLSCDLHFAQPTEAIAPQIPSRKRCLNLPVLITVDGTDPIRDESTPEQAAKLRMALTAAVKFLAALDVLEFPVFGLFINKGCAIATMAWATRLRPSILSVDTEDTRRGLTEVHVLEQGCTSFEITHPCGIYNLSTFLLRLRLEHAPRLAALVQEALDDDERRQRVASTRWTTADQTSDTINLQALWAEDEDSPDGSDSSSGSHAHYYSPDPEWDKGVDSESEFGSS